MADVETQEQAGAELADDGNGQQQLTTADFKDDGTLKSKAAELALVVQSAQMATEFLSNKQWNLLWRDADMLYQAPRPMSVYENTYILEPNVQRFTVAKVCNAVVPQLYKGLFYDDPPMIVRPRPGTSQNITDAKTALFSFILDECDFKTQTKWGLEQMAHLGTGIWKWGYEWKIISTYKRKATVVKIDTQGPTDQIQGETYTLPTDEPPSITRTDHSVPLPYFEFRPIDKVLVDPQTSFGDIRHAGWVVDLRYMDWYEFTDLKKAVEKAKEEGEDGAEIKNWKFPSDKEIDSLWDGKKSAEPSESEQSTYVEGMVHHAEKDSVKVSPDPRRTKLEVLEYWDKGKKIRVINKQHVFYSGENEFKMIPFLSANWWNRAKAFYGMGLGLIVGQNQRVDQGTINAILKILSFGVNPVYLRNRDDNAPTQMIRTGLGKILTVSDTEKSYRLMETPKVPPDVWAALQESERATESSSGADQMLVQGSTAGPRSSMGRTAGGANILAGASATRLDGPLDNFIEQVFKPFLYIMDMLVYNIMSDWSILTILGKEQGDAFIKGINMQEFHTSQFEYEVLAGASLSAKRTMAQSMVMLTQILDNPQIQEQLANINEEYIDFKPIVTMWLEASEWKNKNDIIKPMTQQMKAKRAQESKAAQMQMQMQAKQQADQQKFEQKKDLQSQSESARLQGIIVKEAAKTEMGSSLEGGMQADQPSVL